MFRTPKNPAENNDESSTGSPPKTVTIASKVRRSIGEWEAVGTSEPAAVSPLTSKKEQAGPAKPRVKKALSQDCDLGRKSPTETKKSPKTFANRTCEARACLNKAKLHLNNSRNLRSDIKNGVIEAIDRMYRLVKESEASNKGVIGTDKINDREKIGQACHMEKVLEEHAVLVKESLKKMDELKASIEKTEELKTLMEQHKETIVKATYASVVTAGPAIERTNQRAALHSVVISSKNDQDTGEEVLEKVRKAIDAKEGWVKIEKVRKAKDRKVVVGCATTEERKKIKERLEKTGQQLVVEEVKNRDPLLVLKDVLSKHSDEEVLKALRNQNQEIFHNLNNEANRMVVKYRKKARNPHTNHIVLTVSPTIWRRAVDTRKVRVDLQKVYVEDQSPLVQCSRCLGHGHGRKFCKEPEDLCSHCGGPHLSPECPDKMVGEAPECINCKRAKLENRNHNAFSKECPVKKKWDTIARASVSYC